MTTTTADSLPTGEIDPQASQQRARLGFPRGFAIVLSVLLNVALVAAIAWLVTHQDRVADQFSVWDYSPTATIAQYADRSTMTEEGRFLFYASQPSVAAGDAFDSICASREEGVGILGCYVPSDRSIHLFDVTDERLDGLEEVVASHEMLHAVWDRMSADDRADLGILLEAEVTKRADDQDLIDTLAFYAAAEPGERLNELHSILGTEYPELSSELETHYARYFIDRTAVTTLHETSNAVFVAQEKELADLIAKIDALVAEIDADYARYNEGYDVLSADIESFNARAGAGDFSSQAQFDGERNALLARQNELDALYSTIESRNDDYDVLVAQVDELNAQVDELNQSINITPRDSPQL